MRNCLLTCHVIPWRLILSANFLWTLFVTLTTGVVCTGFQMGIAWPWILLVLIFFVIGTAARWRRICARPVGIAVFGTVLLLLVLILNRYLFGGFFLSKHPDLWAYCADAEYLIRFGRGTDAGTAPLYLFAAALSDTRLGTFSILAFLACLFRLDAVHMVGLYTAILLFNIFWGVALLARFYGAKPFVSLVAGAYAVLCGLIPDAVNFAALDNLLLISVLPFGIIRLQLLVRGDRSFFSILGLALSAAAAFYSYPEGLAVAGVVFLPIFITVFLKSVRQNSPLRIWPVFTASSLLLVAPYLTTFFRFLTQQFYSGAIESRIGDHAMRGLLSNVFLPSIFGSGDEFGGQFRFSYLVLGVICLGLLLVGILGQKGRKRLVVTGSVLLVLLFAGWQAFVLRYSYGLFKVLLVSSILTTPLIFCGIQFVSRFLATTKEAFSSAPALALLVALSAFAERKEGNLDYLSAPRKQIRSYAELTGIRRIVGDVPLRLSFESSSPPNLDDGVDQLWATYFLRDTKLDLPRPKLYLYPVLELPRYQKWRKEIEQSARFLLSNRPQGSAIWSNDKFALTRLSKD